MSGRAPGPANSGPADSGLAKSGLANSRRWRRRLLRVLRAIVFGCALLVVLFVVNGVFLASGQTPVVGRIAGLPEIAATPGDELRVLAWNIAKCSVHRGGLRFASRGDVEARLEKIAATLREADADLVILNEAVVACGPFQPDQVEWLARSSGYGWWVFGENYNFGVPLARIVGGNAILSRRPLEPVGNPDLVGRQPFWVTKNNRRVLVCRVRVGAELVSVAALHTDSFRAENNLRQSEQIAALLPPGPAILAGDFNARPEEPSLTVFRASGRFVGAFDGPPSFPKKGERIDYVLAPASWEHLETLVLEDARASDHFPILARFRPGGRATREGDGN